MPLESVPENSLTQEPLDVQTLPRERQEDQPRLGEQLVVANLISATDLNEALTHHATNGKRIGETLLELGLITEDDLLPYIEQRLGVTSVRLREGLIDPQAIRLLPQKFAEKHAVLPLVCVRGTLTVAMGDPSDLQLIDELEQITGVKIQSVFAFARSVERMIKRVYEEDFVVDAMTANLEESALELNDEDSNIIDIVTVEEMAEGSPIINLVNFLIVQSIRQGVSDIHIEPGRQNTSVRYRIDGQLVEAVQPRREMHPAIVSRIKVMAKLDIAEQRVPQDGRCQVSIEGKEVDLRISTLPTVLGEKVVMRILDRSQLTFNLDKLGMSSDTLEQAKRLISKPHGLLLVTGPTGSGKTTTLYSALELMKSIHNNIITVEDPVEYQLSLINQVQTDKNRSLDFATALRAILRQDPDVIMVGEIRDSETAAMAVQAALTGHLVLSTLHTNDSASAITRLVDMGVEPYKVAAALVGVLAQRLVRKICPNCKTTHYPKSEYLQAISYSGKPKRNFSRGEGCRHCLDTGFKGRVGIYEVMEVDQTLRDTIVKETNTEAFRKWFRNKGCRSLLDSGFELAEQDMTSLEEVSKIALFE